MIKIVIHDYAGHPFQLELSNYLSSKYVVHHLYFKNDYGPKANFEKVNVDNLNIEGLGENINYSKNNFISRFFNDIKYGKIVADKINKINPDIIISGNCPSLAQQFIKNASKKNNSNFIMWVQDFYSIAVKTLLKKKFFIFAFPIYFFFEYLEKKQLKEASKIIIISEEFKNQLNDWSINIDKINFIPNWGNLKTINFYTKKNVNFLNRNNLDSKKFYLLYSGTLAMKHNPNLIIEIANDIKDIEIIVIGVGSGYDNLKNNSNLPKNINLFPIQPFDKIDEILSSTDLCLGILNDDASNFSVPSKILNYLCAGKPIILNAPKKNLASKTITISQSGKVFASNEIEELKDYIKFLKNNPDTRNKMSLNARKFAEENFDINKIGNNFDKLINSLKINKK
jgi:glycosyltransferase involved in cell wall biosynthesis